MDKKQQKLRHKLHTWRLMRRDRGRRKRTDWRFLFIWLVQTSAIAVLFLISLGAVISGGWGVLSYLGCISDPEGVPALQNLEWYIQDQKICHYIGMSVGFFKMLCAKNYFSCVILLLILFLVLVSVLMVLLNRLAAVREIRR